MISPRPVIEGRGRAFLVERYLSSEAALDLAASTAELSRLCSNATHSNPGVQYLYSAYLPSEDTCFCLFRAASSDAVRAVNSRAQFALDRVTDAALFVCAAPEPRPDRPTHRERT
jgi:hypothetical protein